MYVCVEVAVVGWGGVGVGGGGGCSDWISNMSYSISYYHSEAAVDQPSLYSPYRHSS